MARKSPKRTSRRDGDGASHRPIRAAGMSRDDIAVALQVPPDTLEDLLQALLASGQVRTLNVNGKLVYRAAW
jgi:hypothetical protein